MSLPPGFLDELRQRLSLAQVVGRKVMWDKGKSNQGKGDMWAPCPFHQEKTASFHVDDRKGFYYCFGCHAKGDAITFVRETENVDFIEAVRILAGEAGLPMPERDPQAQQKADRRTELAEVMEQAVRFFRLQLRTGAAGAARDYLAGRGLTSEALERWEIGFAPDSWQALSDHLRGKGVSAEMLLEAGLVRTSDRGREPYDTFRNRIIFPIRDARGRAIAFGGRAMDPNDNAKYLNSPETELFDKSRSLYNHGPAREAAGKGQPLIVAEGYMDVIALSEAGFEATVAPLGTAITAHQLALMWRMADEPVIALDGDTAGSRAAMRLIDVALPMLEAGKSLRFALLPDGQDPDDLLKASGAEAMKGLLDRADPLISLIWRRETEGRTFSTPDAIGELKVRIAAIADTIPVREISKQYSRALNDLAWTNFEKRKPRRDRGNQPDKASPGAKASVLAAQDDAGERLREAAILAVLLTNPDLLSRFEAELDALDLSDSDNDALRRALLRHAGAEDLHGAVAGEVGASRLEKLLSNSHVDLILEVIGNGDSTAAEMCLAEELAKLTAARGHAREIAEAEEDLSADFADEYVTKRLAQSARALDRAGDRSREDRTEYDTGPNGARINREERLAFEELLSRIGHGRGKPAN